MAKATVCKLTDHSTKESRKFGMVSKFANAFNLIVDSGKIFGDYDILNGTKDLMLKMFSNNSKIMDVITKSHGGPYGGIFTNIKTNKADAYRIKRALQAYIGDVEARVGDSIPHLVAGAYDDGAWDRDLSATEMQFVKDIAQGLNDIINVTKSDLRYKNISTIVEGIINKNIIGKDIEGEGWQGLINILSLTTPGMPGRNNMLGFLGMFKNVGLKFELDNIDGTKSNYAIKDLYDDNDTVMANAFGALFAGEGGDNSPILRNPTIYRQAIKQYMKATENDDKVGLLSGIMKRGALAKMSAVFLNPLASAVIGIQSAFTGYMNIASYTKMNSKASINTMLDFFGFKKDYFKGQKDPAGFFRSMLNKINPGTGSYINGATNASYAEKLFSDPRFANFFSGPMNILGDTIWRGQYQQIAMDKAMERTGLRTKSDLYMIGSDGSMVLNEGAYARLLSEFIDCMSDVVGVQSVDGGGMMMLNGKYKKTNSMLKMSRFLKVWSTNYFVKTMETLAGGAVGFFTTQEQKDNAYNGPGGNWLIKQYTRSIESDGYKMPWEHAKPLVTSREFAQEIARLIAGFRNAFRLAQGSCEDDDGNLDWKCAMDKTLSIAYLPYQALQNGAIPELQYLFKTVKDSIDYSNYYKDNPDLNVKTSDVVMQSIITNIVKPMFKSLYLVDVAANTFDRQMDKNNENSFLENLVKAAIRNSEGMMYYNGDELSSYTYKEGAYGPKSLLNNDSTIFGGYNTKSRKDTLTEIGNIKKINSYSRGTIFSALADVIPVVNLYSRVTKGEDGKLMYDSTSFYEGEKVEDFLRVYNADEGIQALSNGKFTEEMLNDYDYMQFVWNHIAPDWQTYGAEFKDGKRVNKYNTQEIDYTEKLLEKEIKDATLANPNASDLEIYDKALQIFFQSNPGYEQIKQAIQYYADHGETGMGVYTDYLANAHWNMETTGIKGIAILAEYRKRMLMDKVGIQYSSKQTDAEKAVLRRIENQVAGELGPYMRLVDRREYGSIEGAWFIKKHPEYAKFNPFEGLLDGEGNLKPQGDVKTTGSLGKALRAQNLCNTEIATGELNGYKLVNVLIDKFGSPYDGTEYSEDKAAGLIATVNYMTDFMEDAGITPFDRMLTTAVVLGAYQPLMTDVLTSDKPQFKKLREKMGEEQIGNLRLLHYDTYSGLTNLPELLDHINDADLVEKIFKNNSTPKYKGGSGYSRSPSLYYGNKTYPQAAKLVDYYKKPIDAFKTWGSKTLTNPTYGNGKGGRYAGNYSPREFYFLQQRCYRNPINSDRLAPDIPLPIGGFSKATVKAKNPVSGNTTNIKPAEKGATAKLGQSKGIVGGSKSRGPVSSFRA